MCLHLLPVPPGLAINCQVIEFSLNVLQRSEAWWVSLTIKAAVNCMYKIITRWWRVEKQENPKQSAAFHRNNHWMGDYLHFCAVISWLKGWWWWLQNGLLLTLSITQRRLLQQCPLSKLQAGTSPGIGLGRDPEAIWSWSHAKKYALFKR